MGLYIMLQSDENYRDVRLRYQNAENRVEIYSAYDNHRHKEVIIKRITCDTEEDANFYMVEGQNTISERHPNICECYDVCVDPNPNRRLWRTVIVMEKLDHDLFEEIEQRRLNRSPIEESKLMLMIAELVAALAYLQRKNLAHRDIKPHNIFIDGRGKAKLGDFGSSKEYKISASGLGQHTMQGTPLYLSPKIREAYAQSFAGPVRKVIHNIYKSDVFSLGLTMMHAMTLNPPNDLAFTRGLEDRISAAMLRIEGFSRVKAVVGRMLIVDEERRPDFVQLDRDLGYSAAPAVLSPAPLAPSAPSEPQVAPQLVEGVCDYCKQPSEVFDLCHKICFVCFTETSQAQANLKKVHIACRCGELFPPQLLAMVLEPSAFPSNR